MAPLFYHNSDNLILCVNRLRSQFLKNGLDLGESNEEREANTSLNNHSIATGYL